MSRLPSPTAALLQSIGVQNLRFLGGITSGDRSPRSAHLPSGRQEHLSERIPRDTSEGPANDAFINPRMIDPRRRILRATRPPKSTASRSIIPRQAFTSQCPPVVAALVVRGDTDGATASVVDGGAAVAGNNDGDKTTSSVAMHLGSDNAIGGLVERQHSIPGKSIYSFSDYKCFSLNRCK